MALGCRGQPESIFARKNTSTRTCPRLPDFPVRASARARRRPEITVDGAASGFGRRASHGGRCGEVAARGLPGRGAPGPGGGTTTGAESRSSRSPGARHAIAAEAAEFFSRLRDTLVWLGVNDGNMEEGSLRCDANVSVRPKAAQLGPKAEVRTSTRSVTCRRRSSTRSIGRSRVSAGGTACRRRALRLLDRAAHSMRSNEQAHDYATSPSPISRRWSSTRRASSACARRCPSCPRRSGSASSPPMGCPTMMPAC